MCAAIVSSSALYDYSHQHNILSGNYHKAVAQHNGFAVREDTLTPTAVNATWSSRKIVPPPSSQQQHQSLIRRLANQPPQTLQILQHTTTTSKCLKSPTGGPMTVQSPVSAAATNPNAQRLVFAAATTGSTQPAMPPHRKLDRSFSEPVQSPQQIKQLAAAVQQQQVVAAVAQQMAAAVQASQQQQQPQTPTTPQTPTNSSRYKTELCRPFEENGTCKYGDKCQFAHGEAELRSLARHPKYKTELCRTFHTTGLCPYGPRCHFIHNNDESRKNLLNNLQQADMARPMTNGNMGGGVIGSASMINRPKALSIGSFSLGSAGELSPPSSPTIYDDAFNPIGNVFTPGFGQFGTGPTDFSALVSNPPPMMRNSNMVNGFSSFGGSQPSLMNGAGGPFSAGLTLGDVFQFPAVLPPAPPTQQQQSPILSGQQQHHPLAQRSLSLNNTVSAILEGPPSPVDSLSSELEAAVSLSSTNGSPAPGNRLGSGSPPGRLPIFNQLAGAGSISE